MADPVNQDLINSNTYFPQDVYKWMKINANPKMLLKLMHLCKYFQRENFPCCTVKSIETFGTRWEYTTLNNIQHDTIFEMVPENLWITEKLELRFRNDLVTLLLPKIAVCDVKFLQLNHQNLSYEEFKILTKTGNIKKMLLEFTNIKYANNNDVELENLLQCLPNVEKFSIYSDEVTKVASMKSIEKVNNIVPPKLQKIRLSHIRHNFDYRMFFIFVENNPQITYDFNFERSYARSVYKEIQHHVDKINKIWANMSLPIYIRFNIHCIWTRTVMLII